MLFNSYIYLLLFLPLCWAGFRWLRDHQRHEGSLLWLNVCSFIFYGWWNPAYLPLLAISIGINFQLGKLLAAKRQTPAGKPLMILGVALNLGALAFFKYTGFALVNLNAILGTQFHDPGIILPLAISFFTFNQIAYLVDAYEGAAEEYSLNHYALFVTFFPHLLAGPIVHHRELIPQFFIKNTPEHDRTQWTIGITVISFGLFKKLIMADALADYANQVFAAAGRGIDISASEAWLGILSFNLQVYFDFSGYCDIACGSALLFGITLPQNFLSPFKAGNIIDYWKYWHITLSRFITSYVYTPLMRNTPGGTLFSKAMLITLMSMGISGLWHGANWTFIFWGLAHGALLVINHCWRKTPFSRKVGHVKIFQLSSILLTYVMVTLTMVLFRSPDLAAAHNFYSALFDLDSFYFTHQIQQPVISDLCRQLALELSPMQKILPVIIFMHVWIWLLPNLQQVMAGRNALCKSKTSNTKLLWQENFFWALLAALALSTSIMSLNISSDFVYFQF